MVRESGGLRPAISSRAHFDAAAPHLSHGLRPMYKKAETFLSEQAPTKCLCLFIRTTYCQRARKSTIPKAPRSSKMVLIVRLQGLEPWTP